jgi:hypothetical protein
VQKGEKLVNKDQKKSTTLQITGQLGLSNETCLQITKEDSNMQLISTRFAANAAGYHMKEQSTVHDKHPQVVWLQVEQIQ